MKISSICAHAANRYIALQMYSGVLAALNLAALGAEPRKARGIFLREWEETERRRLVAAPSPTHSPGQGYPCPPRYLMAKDKTSHGSFGQQHQISVGQAERLASLRGTRDFIRGRLAALRTSPLAAGSLAAGSRKSAGSLLARVSAALQSPTHPVLVVCSAEKIQALGGLTPLY